MLSSKENAQRWQRCIDKASKRKYFWNKAFDHSLWEHDLETELGVKSDSLDGDHNDRIWACYARLQNSSAFLQCSVCHRPIPKHGLEQCSLCAQVVHTQCFDRTRVACRFCIPKNNQWLSNPSEQSVQYPVQLIHNRINGLLQEFSPSLRKEFAKIKISHSRDSSRAQLQSICTTHFQRGFSQFFIQQSRLKNNSLGAFATAPLPKYTRVAIYPGYPDILAGNQCKYGREMPKYAVDVINCADMSNMVFEEFRMTCGPYINEPCPGETANCGWILEAPLKKRRRYSILTTRDVREGEELLIGYGPEYLRDYSYTYDQYIFIHSKEGKEIAYDLYRWQTNELSEHVHIERVRYSAHNDSYAAV